MKKINEFNADHPEVIAWIARGMDPRDPRWRDFLQSNQTLDEWHDRNEPRTEADEIAVDRLIASLSRCITAMSSAKTKHDKLLSLGLRHYHPHWQLSDIIADFNNWIKWLSAKQ